MTSLHVTHLNFYSSVSFVSPATPLVPSPFKFFSLQSNYEQMMILIQELGGVYR